MLFGHKGCMKEKKNVVEEDLRERIKDWPPGHVLWLEPTGGIPPGQPDTLLWAGGRWLQVELKRKGEPPGNLRPSQRKHAVVSARAGIPYFVAVLDPKSKPLEVVIWERLPPTQGMGRRFFKVGSIELEVFDPNTLAHVVKMGLSLSS